jgi:putative endonuclease
LARGFTKRYRIHRLVYYETFRDVRRAIARETEIKRWQRAKKVALIEAANSTWEDLAAGWFNAVVMNAKADSSLRSE